MSAYISPHERRLRPIYDALDTQSYKAALQSCAKALKKNPTDSTVQALKAIALERTGKAEEALALCTLIRKSPNALDKSTMHALFQVYRNLNKDEEVSHMFSAAIKADPTNEDLGNQWFIAMVRNQDYKGQQAAAITLQKNFKSNKYHWWSIMSLVLQSTSAKANPLSLTLAERMATRAVSEGRLTRSEEFYLLLHIFELQQKHTEALSYLYGDDEAKVSLGKKFLPGNIELLRTKRNLFEKTGTWKPLYEETKTAIQDGDEDWHTMAAFSSATLRLPNEHDNAKDLLKSIVESTSPAHRGPCLARLELASKLKASSEEIIGLYQYYFTTMGSKFCFFEDIQPYLADVDVHLMQKFLNSLEEQTTATMDPLQKVCERINVAKLQRYCQITSHKDVQAVLSDAAKYSKEYADALSLGRGLEDTETQHGNPFALLAAHCLVDASPSDQRHLIQAIVILEHAVRRSRADYQLKLLLIRLYRLLGSFDRAIEIYETLDIKQVQHDTLSHFLTTRISSLAPLDRLKTILLQADSIYRSNDEETPEMITQAYNHETYSKVEEFIEFGDRLKMSLQRSLNAIERIRLEIVSVPTAYAASNQFNATSEAMSFISKVHHPLFDKTEDGPFRDNRDVKVLASFTPTNSACIRDLTLAGPQPMDGWILHQTNLLQNLQRISTGAWKEIAKTRSIENAADLTSEETRTILTVETLMQLCVEATKADATPLLEKIAGKLRQLVAESPAIRITKHPDWKVMHALNAENERILYYSVTQQAMTVNHAKAIHKSNASTIKSILGDLRQFFSERLDVNKKLIDELQQSYFGIKNRDTILESIKKDNVLESIWEDDEVYGVIVRITDGWKKGISAMQMMAKAIRL